MHYAAYNDNAQLHAIGHFSDQSITDLINHYGLNKELECALLTNEKKAISDFQDSNKQHYVFIHCGKKDSYTLTDLNSATQALVKKTNQLGLSSLYLQLPNVKGCEQSQQLKQQIITIEQTNNKQTTLKSGNKNTPAASLEQVFFSELDDETKAQAIAVEQGMQLCQTLANLPANICTPTFLADQAIQLENSYDSIKTQILNEDAMHELGMGALLSVSQGSTEPAQFIEMHYDNGGEQAPIVLVGKGITFDSGGLSLKPATGMVEMKYDMCGAATVIGVMKAVAQMKLNINVIGLVAASENMPGMQATKPGDVITSLSKQTIEVLNTDAEGRLVLCDALTYAERFKPAKVIDIATLTGAAIVALGHKANAIMSNDDTLAKELMNAGQKSDDKAWQLPIWEEYQSLLDSNIADMSNISKDKSAGTITAACFLARFAKSYSWAHIDCAGTAWVSGNNKAATARPVPLLCEFLLEQCA